MIEDDPYPGWTDAEVDYRTSIAYELLNATRQPYQAAPSWIVTTPEGYIKTRTAPSNGETIVSMVDFEIIDRTRQVIIEAIMNQFEKILPGVNLSLPECWLDNEEDETNDNDRSSTPR